MLNAQCSLYIIALNVHLCALTSSIRNKLHAASINPWYDFPFLFRYFCSLWWRNNKKRVRRKRIRRNRKREKNKQRIEYVYHLPCIFSISLNWVSKTMRDEKSLVYFAIAMEHLTFNFWMHLIVHQLKYGAHKVKRMRIKSNLA